MSLNFNAFKWNLLQTFGMQGLNIGVSIILARILGPKEFGILALAMVFISIGQTIMNGGLSESVIRLQKPTNIDYNSLFFLNLIFALVIYFLFYFSRNFFAKFMSEPLLASIIPLLSLVIIINAFSIVQSSKLNRELNFKKQFLINIPATIFSSILGLYFAYNGHGVYALIYMQLIFSLTATILLWLTSNYFPNLTLDKENILKHFKFGFPLSVNNLFGSFSLNLNSFIIGKYFSVIDLGLINRAQSLKDLSINNFINIANKNLLPLYSNKTNDFYYLFNVYKKTLNLIFLLFIPLSTYLIVNASLLIEILLGSQWADVVLYFQIIMIASVFEVASRSSISLLKVFGKAKMILTYDSIFNIILIVTSLFAIYLNLIYLLIIISIINVIKFFIYHHLVNQYFNSELGLNDIKNKIDIKSTILLLFVLTSISLLTLLTNKVLIIIFSSFIMISFFYFLVMFNKNFDVFKKYIKGA